MRLWFSLLLGLVACSSNRLEPGQTASTASTSRPATSVARVRDTGGGIDTLERSQRRISRESTDAGIAEKPAAARSEMKAPDQKTRPAEMKRDAGAQQLAEGEDAGPAVSPGEDAGAAGAAGVSGAGGDAAGMSGAAGIEGGAGMSASAMNTGSCCEASDLPGCGTPETQMCVCELQPRCCMVAWDETCTFIVKQKFCQPGVRQCVCGSAMGQWDQPECCSQNWTDTCDSVALNKCNARESCM